MFRQYLIDEMEGLKESAFKAGFEAALFFMKGNKNRTFNTNKRYSRKI